MVVLIKILRYPEALGFQTTDYKLVTITGVAVQLSDNKNFASLRLCV